MYHCWSSRMFSKGVNFALYLINVNLRLIFDIFVFFHLRLSPTHNSHTCKIPGNCVASIIGFLKLCKLSCLIIKDFSFLAWLSFCICAFCIEDEILWLRGNINFANSEQNGGVIWGLMIEFHFHDDIALDLLSSFREQDL